MSRGEDVSGGAVARGVLWRVLEVAGTEVLAFGAFVLLARLLLPDQFGVVSQATIFILTAQLILQQGLPEALVQKEDVSEAHIDSCFWANLGLGAGAALLLGLLAPLTAAAFAEPDLAIVLIALAPTLLLLAASRIILAKLRRELRFRGFMALNVAATFAGAVTAIALAVHGFGVWSLVAQQWVYALTGLAAGCVAAGWTPRMRFNADHIREMWAFSGFTVLEALLAFCARRLDLLILALFWSAHEVGFYFLATRLLFSAGMLTYYSISHLGLPFLARLTDDADAYREAIYRTMHLVTLSCLPTLIGLALVAPLLIPLLFGDAWVESTVPFQALAAFSIFYAMALMSGQVLISAGHARDAMMSSAATMVVFLIGVALAAPFGITSAAIAGGIANALVLPIYGLQLRSRFGVDLKRLAREQMPCWLAVAAMTVMVLGLDAWLGSALSPFIHLPIAVLVGASAFITAMMLFARKEIIEILACFFPGTQERDRLSAEDETVSSKHDLAPG